MKGYARIRYYKSNTYGGGFDCETLTVSKGWNGRITITLQGSSSTLELVEVELPKQAAQVIAWAIQGVIENYADKIQRKFENTG